MWDGRSRSSDADGRTAALDAVRPTAVASAGRSLVDAQPMALTPARVTRPPVPSRLAVIGNTAAGKSTLARSLARCLGLDHVELDAFQHEADWTPADPATFQARVARAIAGDRWVVDGNYALARELVWPRAETLVWLDYSLPRVLLQLFRRTIRRLLTREELWNGNRERWRTHFLSRESLFLWAVRVHARRRREFRARLGQADCAQLTIVRLRTPRQTATWLAALCAAGSERQLRTGSLAVATRTRP
jgi:adenylate kinase family enzyme